MYKKYFKILTDIDKTRVPEERHLISNFREQEKSFTITTSGVTVSQQNIEQLALVNKLSNK